MHKKESTSCSHAPGLQAVAHVIAVKQPDGKKNENKKRKSKREIKRMKDRNIKELSM